MKKLIAGAAAALAVGWPLAFTATPALASNGAARTDNYTILQSGFSFSFAPVGDRVEVCDIAADGARAVLTVTNVTKDPNVKEYDIEAVGEGNCRRVDASMGQPWNLAETHCFRFRARTENNGEEGPSVIVQLRNYNDLGPLECPGVD
jgi:hypothetical protein